MQWGKKWPVQMNLPFFAVEAYVPGGGPESGRKKIRKNALRPVPVQKFTFQVIISKSIQDGPNSVTAMVN